MKKTKIGSLLFLLALSFCTTAGSLAYKGQTSNPANASAVPSPTCTVEDLNLADSTQMNGSGAATIVGNVLKFGPSIGAFVSYKSKKTYEGVHMAFDSALSPDLSPDWQRIIFRAADISDSLAGQVKGYFVSLYKDNYHLYKQVETDKYISLANKYYPNEISEHDNLYTGNFHKYDLKCYNVSNGVFMSLAIDDVVCFNYVDDGVDHGAPLTTGGYAGLYMNSSKASWLFRTEMTDSAFKPNLFLGNPDIYDPTSTANIKKGCLEFANNDSALVYEETSITQTEFNISTTVTTDSKEFLRFGVLNSKLGAKSLSTLDGLYLKFYIDRVIVCAGQYDLAKYYFDNPIANDFNIKLVTFCVAGSTTLCLKFDGAWHVISTSDVIKASGYVAIYGLDNATIKAAAEEDKNFRVLFIGNSITSHGPNADLNYHIGTTTESWGMATSAPEYDYVHTAMKFVRGVSGYENAEFMAINVANWEHDLSQYDIANVYQAGAEFEADIIVGRLGENVTSMPSSIHFEYYYNKLLDFFNSKGDAQIFLTTKYWGSSNVLKDDSVDTGTINLARHNNYPLIRLNDLGSTYAEINNATADYDYYHNLPGTAPGGLSWGAEYDGWTDGVKQHPGMVGHENIGTRVGEALVNYLTGKDAHISTLEAIDDTLSVEYNTSNIAAGKPGAYDIKKVSSFKATAISDFSKFKLPSKYLPFKGYEINTDGTPYRFEMTLDEDTTAQLTYKAYTYNANKSDIVEVKCVNDADSVRDGTLKIDGNVNGLLLIAVEYDTSKIFQGNTFSDPKCATILNFYNKGNDNYIIDLSTTSKYLTINTSVFSTLIASGRDVEIRLKTGTFVIDRELFEVIAGENRNLNFSIDKFTSNNDRQNATTVINGLPGFYGLETEDGLVSSIYEAQIAFDNRNGDALYVGGGLEVQLPIEVSAEKVDKLAVVGAVLPAVGTDVKNVAVLPKDAPSYEDGILSIDLNDLDKDLILALNENKESFTIGGSYKTTYTVGDALDVTGMVATLKDYTGKETNINVTANMVSGFDSSKAGKNTITISYKGYSATVELTINEKAKSGGCGGSIIAGSIILPMLLGGSILLLGLKKRKESK